MKKHKPMINNQSGFTLVEIIAVLIILGILAAVAVPRYIDLQENARGRAIDAAISELNGRENLAWAQIKIDGNVYSSAGDFEDAVWAVVAPSSDIDLGSDYSWGTGGIDPASGGSLSFQGAPGIPLTRALPTVASSDPTKAPYVWSR